MAPRRLEETRHMRKRKFYSGHGVPDAASMPPSVFAAHVGEPEITHDDHQHDRARRHSVVTHQEKFAGI